MRVWFQVQPQGEGVLVTPYLDGTDRSVLRYELESQSRSIAGSSSIRQAGGIQPLSSQPTPITRLRMSPTNTGECEIRLKIFDGHQLLAEKTLTDCRPTI